jgi:hypothetical protein
VQEVEGPTTEAEELLELGQRYVLSTQCKCCGCKITRIEMENNMREDILLLAQAWAKADKATQFRGLFEKWDALQIAMSLGVSINL